MTEKEARLDAIKTIIKTEWIHSQDLLLNKLEKAGFETTQATLSRDLKQLAVAKVADEEGYHYSIANDEGEFSRRSSYLKDLERDVLSMTSSGNMIVVKTRIGHGNSVALAFDNLKISSILGTIGGDDTVFMVLSEQTDKNEFLKEMKQLIPSLSI